MQIRGDAGMIYRRLNAIAAVTFVLLCTGNVLPGGTPATGPAQTQPAQKEEISPAVLVSKLLGKRFDADLIREEAVSPRYTLVRVEGNAYKESSHGRPPVLLRITVDTKTGELRELRGDYVESEADLIDRRRPDGTITAEKAIDIVRDDLRRDGFHPAFPPSHVDIDLVAGQYYIIRFPNRMPQAPRQLGDLGDNYFLRVVVEASSGRILDESMGDGGGVVVK
jgi:hypothetical protein